MRDTELEARSLVVAFVSIDLIDDFDLFRTSIGGSEERLGRLLDGLESKAGRAVMLSLNPS